MKVNKKNYNMSSNRPYHKWWIKQNRWLLRLWLLRSLKKKLKNSKKLWKLQNLIRSNPMRFWLNMSKKMWEYGLLSHNLRKKSKMSFRIMKILKNRCKIWNRQKRKPCFFKEMNFSLKKHKWHMNWMKKPKLSKIWKLVNKMAKIKLKTFK